MTVPTTFEEVRANILERARVLEICDAYRDVALAGTEAELFSAACGLYEWAYQSKLVTSDDLIVLTEETMNLYGIYTRGTYMLNSFDTANYDGCHNTNIELEEAKTELQKLYFAEDVIATLNIGSYDGAIVAAMGYSYVNINLSDKTKLDIFVSNRAVVNIISNGTAVICFKVNNLASLNMTLNGSTVAHGQIRNRGLLDVNVFDNSYAKVDLFQKGALTYNSSNNQIDITQFDDNTLITNGSP